MAPSWRSWYARPPEVEADLNALVGNLVLFVRVLRGAGLPVSTGQTLALARALELVDLGRREHVYHAARSVLVSRREDLPVFDLVFARFWREGAGGAPARPRAMPRAPRHDPAAQGRFTVVTWMAHRARAHDPEVDVLDRSGAWSPTEVLGRKAFSEMSAEELERVARMIRDIRWRVTRRRTRRRVPRRRGELLDLRRSLRETARLGTVPHTLPRRTRKLKERPVVLLADVSGSMETYARLVLQFFYAVQHSLRHVECFVFGTRLTRITPQLDVRNVDRALEAASREVVDWAGGTRIGESLDEFNRRWARRVLERGAVVVVVSDGCDLGDPALLRRTLARLQRRCHRLIWLNPYVGGRGYEPLARGMKAALGHVDHFLPVRDVRSLEVLAAALAAVPAERRTPRPGPAPLPHSTRATERSP